MNNKEMKQMVSALERTAQENKRVTGLLLEKLEIIEDTLINIIKENDLEKSLKSLDYKGFGFKRYSSNVGSFISLVKKDDRDEFGGYSYYSALPSNTQSIGGTYYVHNDYNSVIEYMNKEDVLHFASIAIDFIKNMIKVIESEKKEIDYLYKKLERIGVEA